MKPIPPALEPFLGPLKDFQRRTVDYVFQRMYLDDPPARRFLVADEVGLGKTLVARGILARALHHIYEEVDRIDIVYVCSNAAIARQNLNRLNVTGQRDLAFATRLTLLPAQVKDLKNNKINLVSFTPGTTFDLKSSGGQKAERADMYAMLREPLDLPETGFKNLLQCSAGYESWRRYLRNRPHRVELDEGLAQGFAKAVRKRRRLHQRLLEGCERFARYRKNVPQEENQVRYRLVADLRRTLADMCIEALEPDLIILDEFQRFRDLLELEEDKQSEAARLAQDLMRYPAAKVLLLSATPYRMLTLGGESGEDHYEDFLKTVGFLMQDELEVARLREDFRRFRHLLVSTDGIPATSLTHTRDSIQNRLLSVMVRTERVHTTLDRDAMLADEIVQIPVERSDLKQARLVDRVARAVESHDTIEYWKSAPYLLNLMKGYHLKDEFVAGIDDPVEEVVQALKQFPEQLLRRSAVEDYRDIDPQNGRLRKLLSDTLEAGYWRLLWMPASLPYWAPSGPYEDIQAATKALVFSSWNVVPDVIAAIGSYAAEQKVMQESGEQIAYGELTVKRKGLLTFKTGPSTVALLYPSPTLAREIDPLGIALDHATRGEVRLESVLEDAKKILAARLRETGEWPTAAGEWTDPRWYWAAPLLLDRQFAPEVGPWIAREWARVGPATGEESGYSEIVHEFGRAFRDGLDLGPAPEDLLDVLARLALASPAMCALRSLSRVVRSDRYDEPHLLSAAVEVAEGFRSLYNLPTSVLLLRGDETGTPYWRLVLEYGLQGNLSALLDEYVHVLRESLGLVHHPDPVVTEQIARAAAEALSIRTVGLKVDEYRVSRGRIREDDFWVRCRFALRFGELRDDEGKTLQRIGTVREAFNSPFRPFILASTSIGQEGLDFHTYCHAVYHWNLPSNPVDLEQREGRVHRYKGHAVRKNVAKRFGLEGLRDRLLDRKDPWTILFDLARENRPEGSSDLVPYWVYETEDGARVERRVPMLPFSREEGRLERLKSSLAIYRLAFGQPRQEDLLAYIRGAYGNDAETLRVLDQFKISLSPPEVDFEQKIHPELVELMEEWRAEEQPGPPPDEDRSILLTSVEERAGLEVRAVVEEILDWAASRGLALDYSTKGTFPGVHIGYDPTRQDDWHPLFIIRMYGKGPRVRVPFRRMRKPFHVLRRRGEVQERLVGIGAWEAPPDGAVKRSPTFPVELLVDDVSRKGFLEIFEWVVTETHEWRKR